MEDELLRLGVRRIKALAKLRVPEYDLPADSFLEDAVRDIFAAGMKRVAPDGTTWPDARNRGLLQAAKQALSALDRHARLPWGHPGYPTPTPGAELLYEARDYLRPAIEREEAFRAAIQKAPPTRECGEGWEPWEGGECPIPPDTLVHWRLRGCSNNDAETRRADHLDWRHGVEDIDMDADHEIVAYKIAAAIQSAQDKSRAESAD